MRPQAEYESLLTEARIDMSVRVGLALDDCHAHVTGVARVKARPGSTDVSEDARRTERMRPRGIRPNNVTRRNFQFPRPIGCVGESRERVATTLFTVRFWGECRLKGRKGKCFSMRRDKNGSPRWELGDSLAKKAVWPLSLCSKWRQRTEATEERITKRYESSGKPRVIVHRDIIKSCEM